MHSHRVFAVASLALALASAAPIAAARAEVFLLKSGGRIEGDLLNPKREPGSPYQVRTGAGLRMDLGEAQVSRVVVKSDIQHQYDELRPKTSNTVEGHGRLPSGARKPA